MKLYPAVYTPGGEFSLGTITGGPMDGERAVTLLYQTIDALHPEGHSGIDMGWYIDQLLKPAGNVYREPVYARLPGSVLRAGFDSVNGNHLIMLHGAWERGTIATGYMHLIDAPGWSYGDYLPAGYTIGLCDSTGFSTGHHLHFMMWVVDEDANGVAFLRRVNPLDYFGIEPPPPAVEADGTHERDDEMKVLRRMDLAFAAVALEAAKLDVQQGQGTVDLIDTGNDQQVGVLMIVTKDELLRALPGIDLGGQP